MPYDVAAYGDRGKTWPQSPFVTDSCTSKSHTGTTYDAVGRPLVVTAPDGSTTAYDYYIIDSITVDGRDLLALTNITDDNNHIIGQATNSLGQLALVQENSGAGPYTAYSRTRYYYDLLGNLDSVATTDGNVDGDPNQMQVLRSSIMSYNALGQKTAMTDPDMGMWTYGYDGAGNLIEDDHHLSQQPMDYHRLRWRGREQPHQRGHQPD